MPQTWSVPQIAEVMRSYQGACVLLAAAELELFAQLATPLPAAELAKRLKCDMRGLATLLDALVAMGIVNKNGTMYQNAEGVGAAMTAEGKNSMLAMAQHQANCLRSWAQLARVVKNGKPQRREASIRGEEADYASFIEAMDNISRITAKQLIGQLPERKFTHLLDVGGASGTWTIAFLERYPQARGTLFDLPKVLPQATERLTAAGMLARVRLVGGDFMGDPLPTGADMAWVSAIIHQMSREDCRKLYANVFAALTEGGEILIRDHVMNETRTRPASGAFFAINMLVNTESGGTYTLEEIRHDLQSCGFTGVELLHEDQTMNCIVGAKKP